MIILRRHCSKVSTHYRKCPRTQYKQYILWFKISQGILTIWRNTLHFIYYASTQIISSIYFVHFEKQIILFSGSTSNLYLNLLYKTHGLGFPGGAVVESLPANAGDTGSSPGLGRSHMPRSSWAREPQLLSLCSAAGEAAIVRGPRTAMKSGPRLPQLEKALTQKRRPNTAISK